MIGRPLDYYLDAAAMALIDNPTWRVGQTYMNTLATYRPDLYNYFTGERCDPYYLDSILPLFFEELERVW